MSGKETRRTTIERTYKATPEEVWELWTTKDGIESWWGPGGFTVAVAELDLRPGGKLVYTMTATGAEQIEFMKRAGMPIANKTSCRYTEVVPSRRLAYMNLVDFVPSVSPYETGTLLELFATPDGVRQVLTLDAMHDEVWTQRAVMGWEGELGKLEKLLLARAK